MTGPIPVDTPREVDVTELPAHIAIEITGWLGAALVVLAYGLTTLGWIPATSRWSAVLNIAGGTGLGVNAAANAAWPSAALNLVWLCIAAAGWARSSSRLSRPPLLPSCTAPHKGDLPPDAAM
ncbi:MULTISPECIES: CBU_0592 family membrane protein [Nocardioides]|uniref:CBU-0592-like domain-containing protein n=1 Tax=Nocardioides vastitatis TaxID=2568655 RepID=A0ABW0ZN47_9ACTN|nr:hypothetical protein [Nocardioides sp.]THJ05724.1 hypothetical protein E7Z54_07115 [Nocardioides sp.]